MASAGTLSGLGRALESIGQGVSNAPKVYYGALDADEARNRRKLLTEREDLGYKRSEDARLKAQKVIDEARLLYGEDVARGVETTINNGADPDVVQQQVRAGESNRERTERIQKSRASGLSLAGGMAPVEEVPAPAADVLAYAQRAAGLSKNSGNAALKEVDAINQAADGGFSFGSPIYKRWREAQGKHESGGNYAAVGKHKTKYGYALGKYQFIPPHLKMIGLNPNSETDKQKFLNTPEIQEQLKDIYDQDILRQFGNDPRAYIYGHYGSQAMVKNILSGKLTGDEPQDGGPSANGYLSLVTKQFNKLSDLPEETPYQASSFSKKPEMARAALERMVENQPIAPSKKRNVYENQLKHIASNLSTPEEIEAAKPVLEMLSKLADRTSEESKLDDTRFDQALNQWHANARFLTGLDSKGNIEESKLTLKEKLASGKALTQKEKDDVAALRLRQKNLLDKQKELNGYRKLWNSADDSKKKAAATEALQDYMTTDDGFWGTGLFSKTVFDIDKVERLQSSIDQQLQEINGLLGGGDYLDEVRVNPAITGSKEYNAIMKHSTPLD